MKRSFALLALVAMLALMVMAPGPRQDHDKSTGGVEYHSAVTGADVEVSFTAHGDVEDAKGRVDVRGHLDFNSGTVADFKGDVTCYANKGSNLATFTGEITHFDGAGPSGYFRVTIEDSGPGSGAPDMITANRSDSAFDCEAGHTANNNVNNGNLVVHHP